MSANYEKAATAIEAAEQIMRDGGQAPELRFANASAVAGVAIASALLAVADELRARVQ